MTIKTMKVFDQDDYNLLTHCLDEIVDRMLDFGKTEQEAKEWIIDFVIGHYFPVWRQVK